MNAGRPCIMLDQRVRRDRVLRHNLGHGYPPGGQPIRSDEGSYQGPSTPGTQGITDRAPMGGSRCVAVHRLWDQGRCSTKVTAKVQLRIVCT